MANKKFGRHSGNRHGQRHGGFPLEQLEPRRLFSATVLAQIPTQSIPSSGTATINLGTYFDDPSIPAGDTVVNMQTNMPAPNNDIPMYLTNAATPKTVTNFLQYITTGEYANTIIHRSVPGFVIQGGGFYGNTSGINVFGTIPGESATATLKNTTGTIAMALSSGPNSGTSQWFFNLANNSQLDNTSDGGPFTAFGKVIYNGMTTVNAIAALSIGNATSYNGAWDALPYQAFDSSTGVITFVTINPVVVPDGVNFSAVSGNASIVTASVANGNLTLTPAAGGTTTVTVTATDLGGGTVSSTFTVTVGTTPVFSHLTASSTISYGTATATFSGTIAAGTVFPPSTETVAVTLNGVTQNAALGTQGNFTTTFTTSTLPASKTPYQVTYAYAGDASLSAVTDSTTTKLTVIPGTASIAGTIYSDTNQSGVWNPADPVLPDVMVYIDVNQDGKLDPGDPSTNTDANGNYIFTDLAAGNYTVRAVAPGNYTQTSPAATGALNITLGSGQALTGQTFLDAPSGNATDLVVYRLYSPVTLEHLYTTDPNEYNSLIQYVGTWNGEGQVFSEYSAPATVSGVADEPLYRLYDAPLKQHFWTDSYNEYNTLRQAPWNWNDEGIVGYVFPSAVAGVAPTPLYRLRAPQVHLWTTDVNEYDLLATDGWTQEGAIGYVL